MQYRIYGESLPALEIQLQQGEAIYTESGGMSWMSPSMKMETNMRGGVFGGIGRMFSGESLFMATYTAQTGNGMMTLSSSFPGSIIPLDLSDGKEYICQKSAFLCAQPTVNLSVEFTRRLSSGFLGGEGFILQKLSGYGTAFIEIDGCAKEYELAPGQQLIVSTGNVAAFESTVSYEIRTIKGFKNVLFGGEGLFNTVLTGPGKVYLQTISMPDFASKIIPYIPSSST